MLIIDGQKGNVKVIETIISWKAPGFYKADASKCYHEIQEIGDEVKPEQIVSRAEDPTCELHKCFEWDNTEAAKRWRLHQARNIVCNLIVVEKKTDDNIKKEPITFRVMMKTDNNHDSGYKQVIKVVKDEVEYNKLLENAYRELRAFKQKYSCLVELEKIFALID